MAPKNFQIFDAHTHFFSHSWLGQFYQLAKDRFGSIEELAQELGWEPPPQDPRKLGKRWVAEQDKYGVHKQVLFASKLNDAELLAAAINDHPDRLVGYFMVEPGVPDVRNQTLYSLNILGMRGVLLFPAMHHFHASDQAAYTIYEEAFSASAPVFIHFGNLSIPIFKKLGLPDNIELKYSSPEDLAKPANDFPEVNFIIPHFGGGRFEEALKVAAAHRNVYFDTSSSNTWITPPLTLKEVFRRALETVGPERILFGTDSSFFPRGWRADIFETQLEILDSLKLSKSEMKMIFGANLARILNLTP
ncbi:MAG: amidohydrolase [Caldithrix sp.]|nr:MAG: amidohydrolase [Caldithrix sp.]